VEENDDVLVSECKNGSEDAFRILYERDFSRVFYYCIRFVKSMNEAEDITQDVFIKVFSSINKFRGGNFRGWLFRIAHNYIIDDYRKRSKVVSISLDDVIEPVEVYSIEEEFEMKGYLDNNYLFNKIIIFIKRLTQSLYICYIINKYRFICFY